jgi:hypothetical protein
MAKHQSSKARLSEEIVKHTLEKYERKKLIAHLSSVRLDTGSRVRSSLRRSTTAGQHSN